MRQKITRRQPVELLKSLDDRGSGANIQDRPPGGPGEESGPLETERPQGMHRLKAEERPSLAGARPAAGGGRELEAAAQVERQHTEALPRTVRRVAHERDTRESEVALDLAVDLLVHAAPAHAGPQGAAVDRLVRDDGAVFIMPVVRIEEIELEVLRRFVLDVPAVEHDSAPPLPARDVDRVLCAADGVGDAGPDVRLEHARLEPEPPMKGDFDRVLGAGALEDLEDRTLEKRSIPALLRGHVPGASEPALAARALAKRRRGRLPLGSLTAGALSLRRRRRPRRRGPCRGSSAAAPPHAP